ncbi:MAG: Rne/Rng family ribonuclease [Vicinamibacteria bacterium]|nr:Rne/Rng family ribonuclease [Vicinamibacteria bacterium]
MSKEIIISGTRRETRLALLENGIVSELFIERASQRSVVGNIYKGRVSRVLPGMQSAFVNLGLERDAFLHVDDVFEEWGENLLTPEEQAETVRAVRHASIEQRLHEGQEILTQVVKDPLGSKGARITSHVSLPGRYLVFMPTVEHIGVSRKIIAEDERRRLKDMLKGIRLERGGGGFIVRTAGLGREREDFERDARFLAKSWDEIRAAASRERSPALLHHEADLVLRVLRDILSPEVVAVWCDDKELYEKTLNFIHQLEPAWTDRVRLHASPQSILEARGVSSEIERALRPKVWLESGGTLVINQTEALVAIDVNTGRYVGKDRLEDTILRTNLDAAREIVRQVRLRDLGGIIVVDFIDMEERKSRQQVLSALEQELRSDRSPSKLLAIDEFGLVIITRKRVRESLERVLHQPCPYCAGSGSIKSVETVCMEILNEVRQIAADVAGSKLILRVNPQVARMLDTVERPLLAELAALVRGEISVQADPLLHQEQFDLVTK